MGEHGLLFSVFIYLLAAVVMVPIAKKLGLGAVLGYLIAGIIIGPFIGLVNKPEDVMHFAEFGVVMLLFLIGLELKPSRLWEMRKPILGQGGGQVFITAALLTIVGLLFDLRWQYALVAGMALALSSTAIVLQIMAEKNLMATRTGQSGFSILLFQDIAVIPMLALLPLLSVSGASDGGESGWLGAAKAFIALAAIYVLGRYLLPPLFRYIAATRMREVFTAFTLLLVVGIAVLMDSAGLSMALGTFMAGVLLSESEYRHELEANIEPFKGLLLGLFFISVGMSVNFALLLNQPGLILLLVVLLIAIKALVLYGIAVQTKMPVAQRLQFSMLLSQGGEFAFVLFSLATTVGALETEIAATLTVVVALSMLTTPLLIIVVERFFAPSQTDDDAPKMHVPNEHNPVIIAGFGRIGQIVARILAAEQIGATILDHNPEHIERIKRFGFKAYYGDATRMELLETAGIHEAKILVIALDDNEQAVMLAEEAQRQYPNLKVFSRAWDMVHLLELMKVGVQKPRRETFHTSLLLAQDVLVQMGYGAYEAKQIATRFYRHDRELLNAYYEVEGVEERIALGKDLRGKFESQIEGDAQYREKNTQEWT